MGQNERPRRQYRQVADQILALVAARNLAPGQRLPPERELAELLSVSRPSLREALIALDVEGHVEIRMGSGIYVGPPVGPRAKPDAAPPDVEGPLELMTARCVIESAIAEEAAAHATPRTIARLDDNLREMAAALDDTARAIELDGAFHTEIADATGNAVLAKLTTETFHKRMSPYFAQFSAYFESPRTWRLALEEHGTVRDAIAAADPPAAREAMRRHLTEAGRRFTDGVLAERTEEAAAL